ncbi:tetratricopeptide repeat-containing sensor histidine kinase [Lacibacter sediminis]|uniref:histidine kinase n=1 Tax=Lacibacter sediminis TaxID=2760713 RepID=A0A7G5XK90_9BACT|nr:histidine kinase dimerization/phosphoacceptor domain -containing protein [Lacibacter sediminis]QNA45893.1 hypothetical protein H4075_06795 [Lacibacter sediminis]
MKKSILGIAAILLLHVYCFSQHILPGDRVPMPGDEKELLIKLHQSQPGIPQIEIMLDLSACYLYLPGEEEKDLDKAMTYASQAKQLSSHLKFMDGYNEAMLLMAEILIESNVDESWKVILDSTLIHVRSTLVQVRNTKNELREARAMRQLATIYFRQGNYQLADAEFLKLLELCQKLGLKNQHYNYHRMSIIQTYFNHDYNKALYYALEALKSLEKTGDSTYAGPVYRNLGYIYRYIGMFQKAVDYLSKSMLYYNKNSSSVQLELAEYASSILLKMNRGNDALLFLHKTKREFPPQHNHDWKIYEYSLANCYTSLKLYDSAEIYYKILINRKLNDGSIRMNDYKSLGQLYVESGKYIQAKPYLDKASNAKPSEYPTNWFSHLQFLMYKVDSAGGNYLSAIDHLMKHKALNDIDYEQNKVRNIQELQIKYESEKKDQALKFQAQNIQLLKNQSKTNRNMFIAGAGLFFLILLLIYNRYRVKQMTNIRLELQQKDINTKNNELRKLVNEKEWLLKEVHHRVKNNLHTVMSLLESQSAYLENDALLAIRDSQHRVFSMSLMHQKLYQSEDVTKIDMSVYLPELVNYLSESFNIREHIRFNLELEPLELDVSQAIPLCLILNEAITNAIKYAFPLSNNNIITISIVNLPENKIELAVTDNGIGLPTGFDTNRTPSLGLRLMKGLAEDIGGSFTIISSRGCKISILFTIDATKENEIFITD